MPDIIPYSYPLGLLKGFGVELEYMIVDADSFDVKPVADEVIKSIVGRYESDAQPDGPGGVIGWSNELALHVLELKTLGAAPELEPLIDQFDEHVRRVNAVLAPLGARLLPTAMHPWMDPLKEMRLWPHEFSPVYEALDRIFDCTGHGWANLQSAHINLPFADDEEFARLHAAVRIILPILPALAASSPVMDGRLTGVADNRLAVYRTNARAVPSVSGRVIPERVFTRAVYEGELLASLYRDIAPHDPDGLLRYEWLNARGCIARFDRGAIEIRLLDVQECPRADLACASLVVETIRGLIEQRWTDLRCQQAFEVEPLFEILLACINDGEDARIEHDAFLAALGWSGGPCRAGALWTDLRDRLLPRGGPWDTALDVILAQGTLSKRIRSAIGDDPTPRRLRGVYRELADCLSSGRMFLPVALT